METKLGNSYPARKLTVISMTACHGTAYKPERDVLYRPKIYLYYVYKEVIGNTESLKYERAGTKKSI